MSRALIRSTREFVEVRVQGPACEDVVRTLAAVKERYLNFVAQVAECPELPATERRTRSVGLVLRYASVQLADDLADGDCTYLDAPQRQGPGTQWLLQNLSEAALNESRVSARARSLAIDDFVRTAEGQQREVRTSSWTFDTAQSAAEMLNGCQYRAYLILLLDGTRQEDWARNSGQDFGFALHVVGDLLHGDARFVELPPEDQEELLTRAQQRTRSILHSGHPVLERHGRYFAQVLAGARRFQELL